MTDHSYDIGQRVSVPRGLDVVQGVVEGVYGGGQSEQVIVRIELEGEEFETITLPASTLDRARENKDEHRPGAWLTAYQYERALADTLVNILESLGIEFVPLPKIPQGADFTLLTPRGVMMVEARHLTRETLRGDRELHQLASYLRRAEANLPNSYSGLLVTNARVSHEAIKHAATARSMGESLWIARWTPGETEDELGETVRQALDFKAQ